MGQLLLRQRRELRARQPRQLVGVLGRRRGRDLGPQRVLRVREFHRPTPRLHLRTERFN